MGLQIIDMKVIKFPSNLMYAPKHIQLPIIKSQRMPTPECRPQLLLILNPHITPIFDIEPPEIIGPHIPLRPTKDIHHLITISRRRAISPGRWHRRLLIVRIIKQCMECVLLYIVVVDGVYEMPSAAVIAAD